MGLLPDLNPVKLYAVLESFRALRRNEPLLRVVKWDSDQCTNCLALDDRLCGYHKWCIEWVVMTDELPPPLREDWIDARRH